MHADNDLPSKAIRSEIDFVRFLDLLWLASITRQVSPEWLRAHDIPYGTFFAPSSTS